MIVARLALEYIGGFTVEVRGNGHETMAKIPQLKPDRVLLDVMMPGMDGPATLKALWKRLTVACVNPVIVRSSRDYYI